MERRAGQIVGGRYRLERPLATGGMGAIWVARHVELDVDVALKFVAVPEGEEARARERFRHEARAAARLSSEHVVRVHDFGFDEGSPYLAMELLRGEDLLDHLEREAPIAPERAAELIRQVCKGLDVAHEAGIVHRDLKPSNLFLTRRGTDETLKILDFGVAKQHTPEKTGATTSVGVLLGSPPYMSPEQARARPVDHRTDLWALGAIAFEMLTGKRLFEGGSLTDTVAKICSDPIPRASEVRPELGSALDSFFERALERRPDRRFQSAAELTAAFDVAAGLAQENAPPAERAAGRDTETVSVRVDPRTLEPVQSERPPTITKAPRLAVGLVALGIVAALVWWSMPEVGTSRQGPASAQAAAAHPPDEVAESPAAEEPLPEPSASTTAPPPPAASAPKRAEEPEPSTRKTPSAHVSRQGGVKPPPASPPPSPPPTAPPSPSAAPAPKVDPVFGLRKSP